MSGNKRVANALERAMRRRDMHVMTLALKAGVHVRAVQRITRGQMEKASFWTIARLAHALHLNLNYLAGIARDDKGRPHGEYNVLG